MFLQQVWRNHFNSMKELDYQFLLILFFNYLLRKNSMMDMIFHHFYFLKSQFLIQFYRVKYILKVIFIIINYPLTISILQRLGLTLLVSYPYDENQEKNSSLLSSLKLSSFQCFKAFILILSMNLHFSIIQNRFV